MPYQAHCSAALTPTLRCWDVRKKWEGGGRVCKAVSKGEQSLVVRGVSLTSVQEGSDIPPPFSGVDES